MGQVVAVTLNNYPRPIPSPVHNLRPARETCETCHWPQKYSEDRLKVFPKFAEDETNTLTKTVMLLKIGGGNKGIGIHGTHLGPGIKIRYVPADEARRLVVRGFFAEIIEQIPIEDVRERITSAVEDELAGVGL